MSAGENLMPYERVWTLVACMNLLRATGRQDRLQALIPLARLVYEQQPDEDLAMALSAAEGHNDPDR